MATKEELHRLVEQLPERDWPVAQRVLRSLVETDEEALSDEDSAAVAAGDEAIARGEYSTLEELRRGLGL